MIHARQPHTIISTKEQEYLEGWQRERAELKNYRQRIQEQLVGKERQILRQVIEPLLSVADNFQAITAHVPEELRSNSWVEGVLHVARQLDQVLKTFNIEPINAVGELFDPRIHEAVAHEKVPGTQSGMVVAILQPGYLLGTDVLKPAKVKVSS